MPSFRLATLALIVIPFLAACEGPRTIAGRIRDGAGNPVPGAVLRRSDADRGTETDSAGRFKLMVFASVFDSRSTIRVDAAGYHTRHVRLPYRSDAEVVLVPTSVARRGKDWSEPERGLAAGLHVGTPLRVSTTIGVMRGSYTGFGDYRGWLLAAEPGTGGVKAKLGYMRYGPRRGGQLSVAMLRTGRHALDVASRQGYAGGEARLFLMPWSFSLGGYSRIAGSAPGDRRLLAATMGLGF
jgi:hypothetical protein